MRQFQRREISRVVWCSRMRFIAYRKSKKTARSCHLGAYDTLQSLVGCYAVTQPLGSPTSHLCARRGVLSVSDWFTPTTASTSTQNLVYLRLRLHLCIINWREMRTLSLFHFPYPRSDFITAVTATISVTIWLAFGFTERRSAKRGIIIVLWEFSLSDIIWTLSKRGQNFFPPAAELF